MVLMVDFDKKQIAGTAKAKDIRQLGIIRASAKARGRPINNPEDVTRWSSLFADTDEEITPDPNDQWKPEDDEEW